MRANRHDPSHGNSRNSGKDHFNPGTSSTAGQQAPDQFWNVLTDEWFKGENISGSRRVPLDKVGHEVRSTNLPKNAEIVVYCGGPKCPLSQMAAEKLAKLGYENVRAYEGGLEEWKGAGLPVEKA
jgi:rhodanese-related sulfurtransferase